MEDLSCYTTVDREKIEKYRKTKAKFHNTEKFVNYCSLAAGVVLLIVGGPGPDDLVNLLINLGANILLAGGEIIYDAVADIPDEIKEEEAHPLERAGAELIDNLKDLYNSVDMEPAEEHGRSL